MITVFPLSGFKGTTVFTFQNSPSALDTQVFWDDDTFSYGNTATHVYSSLGLFHVYGGSCATTSAFTLSVYEGYYFTDQITVERQSISSIVSDPYSFTINLSSKDQINTVILYASGSKSSPYQTTRNFWSHLNPEWSFTYNNEPISEITITGSPVYSGSNIIGYSATSAVQFKDDMPGNPILFFTVTKTEGDIPVNSRVYSAFSHSICAVEPDTLYITADGIKPLNTIQWADINIPYIISVGSSQVTSTNILHYVSGNITGIDFATSCYGTSLSAIKYNLATIKLFDSNCFPTGGYILSSFYYPSSALPNIQITNDLEECNYNFDKVEYTKTRNTPKNVVINAAGTFYYNGKQYQLEGESNPFEIVAFENRHAFFRKGEDYNVYQILKDSVPFDLEGYQNFNLYLSAVAGEGDSLGRVYDKIKNFNSDHSDVETCTYDSLINKSQEFDSPIEDYGLELPEELKRLFNFCSVPLQKLIGTRCVCNTNFVDCKGCLGTNVCTICKFDKRNNLGSQILLSDYVSAGDIILYREEGGLTYNFLAIQSQNTDVFKLNSLSAEPFSSKGLDKYCFYKWDKTPQNNPVQSIVNYKDQRNMLNPALSSNEDWYADNGIVEEMFNYVLTKNLIG